MTLWNLAIECSGIGGSVALGSDRMPALVRMLPSGEGSVQHLAPTIAAVLAEAGVDRPDFLSVTVGPGSFTGLRVGITTAKMLAYAWQIPVVPVDTLHAIASESLPHAVKQSLIIPVINAFRKQVFSSLWRLADGKLMQEVPSRVVDAKDWMQNPWAALRTAETRLAEVSGAAVLVAGPGLESYQPDPSLNVVLKPGGPDAAAVALVGWDGFAGKIAVEPDALQPNYIRSSAAEEKRRTAVN